MGAAYVSFKEHTMKCKRCKAQAAVALPSHHTGFCAECFELFFIRQVEKGIKSAKLFTKEDRILIALSGGKDSLACALVLKELGYNVTGLHIDLAIPKSSPGARSTVESFCETFAIPLIVKEMEEEGVPMPLVKEKMTRPICSACGKVKRYYFNKTAIDEGFTVLATGHNLDDEIARLFANTLRWDVAYLSDQGPMLEAENGFAKKVKPLFRLTEFETANYAFLKGIPYHYAPCPYSKGASFTMYKKLWADLEEAMPGRKLDFYLGFLKRGRAAFGKIEEETGDTLAPCTTCGYPTSAGECGVCRIKKAVTA